MTGWAVASIIWGIGTVHHFTFLSLAIEDIERRKLGLAGLAYCFAVACLWPLHVVVTELSQFDE